MSYRSPMSSTDSTLSRAEYRALLRDIKKLVTQSRKKPADEKLDAYWAIGECIRARHLADGVGYGSAIVKDLAADVGLAPRTLYEAIQFFDAYDEPPRDPSLTWTHHRILLRLSSKKDRRFYERKLKEEGWSSRELDAAISTGLHLGKTINLALARPGEPDYLYGAEVLSVVDGDTLDLHIDLGFGVYRKLRARLANVDAPELSTEAGREARDFLAQELMTATSCAVQTVRVDLHGRYVVHLFFARRRLGAAACFKSGTYLNDLLVQKKHAKVVA